MRLWGGVLGILAGLVSGAGISILGIGTRYSFEWVLINGIAAPLALFLLTGNGIGTTGNSYSRFQPLALLPVG